MGLDINRFLEVVDDEFKCSICLNVLERPVHGACGHAFCFSCIIRWLESQSSRLAGDEQSSRSSRSSRHLVGTCPVDRQTLHKDELVEAALPFRALLNRLRIKCDNAYFGCQAVIPLGDLKGHIKDCNFNPDEKIECRNGCRCFLPRRYYVADKHNCLKELKRIIKSQERHILTLESEKLKEREIRRRWKRLFSWFMAIMVIVLAIMWANSMPVPMIPVA